MTKFDRIAVCDFETIVNPEKTRVWAWDICTLNLKHEQGTDIEELMGILPNYKTVYFHNAKFDCSFIIDWCLRNGWKYNHNNLKDDIESDENWTFEILRSSKNTFYSMTLYYDSKHKVQIYDSLKLLPFSVDKLAKAWGLSISKLKIDYELDRPIDHKLTKEESDYIKNDTEIVATVLKEFIEKGFTAMTIGGNALRNFKKDYDSKSLRKALPKLDDAIDQWLRPAYKGGFVWVKPQIQGKDIGIGCVYDNNSMHPSQLRYKPMPYGKPIYFEGEPDYSYPLFVVKILMQGNCPKDSKIPCISSKSAFHNVDAEYLYDIDTPMELTVTNIDLQLIKDQYPNAKIEYIEGMYFNACKGMFDKYIDRWMEEKVKAVDKSKRNIAKLFLNNLYGKFGTRKDSTIMIPYLDEQKNCVKYKKAESVKEPKAEYLPIAIFTTAYSRDLIIRSGQAVFDRLCYCDTDSLHLTGFDIPDNIEIHDSDLGKWKLENYFCKARFLRPKRYMEEQLKKTSFIMNGIYGNTIQEVKCGGMPQNIKDTITWEDFKEGTEFNGKLMPKIIEGGTVLIPTTYKMK